ADDVDEVTTHRLVDHDPGRLARDEERAAGHHVVLEVPVTDRRLEQRLRDRQPGVVDDEIDATEGEDGGTEGGHDLLLVRDVGGDTDRRVRPAQLAGDGLGAGRVDVRNDHAGAFRSKPV